MKIPNLGYVMKKILISILCAYSIMASASEEFDIKLFLQEAKRIGQILDNDIRHKSYIEQIQLTEELLKKNKDKELASNIITQHLTVLYSITGEHQKVIQYEYNGASDIINEGSLVNYVSTLAIPAIITQAKKHQIVMINEAHHIAQHRTLTYQLLEKFWQQGFRYFAVEALNNKNEETLKQGVLKAHEIGYLSEPVFTNLILKAKEIGFILVAYDKAFSNTDERETNAAEVLNKKIFDKDKNAKVLMHVGYSHINEQKWLASKLKKLLKIDPLTIDQTSLREQSKASIEHKTYSEALTKYNGNQPFVLKNTEGNYWSSNDKTWDVTVFWPRTEYIHGRATWASLNRESIKVSGGLCKQSYPCIVEVFKSENKDETATDRVILRKSVDKKELFLSTKNNLIVVSNKQNSIISESAIKL
jgi:hypothetical protein